MKFVTVAIVLAFMIASLVAAADLPRAAGALEITTPAGTTVSASTLDGKAVLVMYFSTDCPHCQHTATVLGPIYAEYKAQGVEFVGVTLNPTAKDNLGSFIEKYAVAFPVGHGDRQHFAQVSGLPVTERFYYPYLLFIDKSGQIQEERQGADRGYFADLNGNIRESIDRLLSGD